MQKNPLIHLLLVISVSSLLLTACSTQSPSRTPQPTENRPAGLTRHDLTESIKKEEAEAAPGEAKQVGRARMPMKHYPSVATSPPAAIADYGLSDIRVANEPLDGERYAHLDDNPIRLTTEQPVSTFSIDVDTGAYANTRRFLTSGHLPQRDAVRVEEMINYFSYNYAGPKHPRQPFRVHHEVAPSPWNKETLLLHIGIKGFEPPAQTLPAANLVFLIDVSGSMQDRTKLPLLKSALKLLTGKLRTQDRVSIVVYAGASGVVLTPTPGNESATIHAALDRLSAGGSTNGAAGIRLAYAMAEQAYIKNGINRVLLATDGDFNVGTVNFEALKQLVAEKRNSGIALTTLGFGSGNYNDHLMEQLANTGNGNYAYIDTLNEAQKALVDEMSSTLLTIAKDVKIQIEFNPSLVAEYRLIGYENRMLRREDFNNDKVDAGDIGAGHSVTALYEIALADSNGKRVAPLCYSTPASIQNNNGELAYLRLRYKHPDSDHSQLIEQPMRAIDIRKDLTATSDDYRFAAAVAAFGQLLKGGDYTRQYSYADVMALARASRGDDIHGYRGEFIGLVNLAQSLGGHQTITQR